MTYDHRLKIAALIADLFTIDTMHAHEISIKLGYYVIRYLLLAIKYSFKWLTYRSVLHMQIQWEFPQPINFLKRNILRTKGWRPRCHQKYGCQFVLVCTWRMYWFGEAVQRRKWPENRGERCRRHPWNCQSKELRETVQEWGSNRNKCWSRWLDWTLSFGWIRELDWQNPVGPILVNWNAKWH